MAPIWTAFLRTFSDPRYVRCLFFFYLIKPLELRRIEIVAISRPNWDKSFSLSDPNATGATTALALSVNGVYLASACKEGIFIWSTQTKHVLWR